MDLELHSLEVENTILYGIISESLCPLKQVYGTPLLPKVTSA